MESIPPESSVFRTITDVPREAWDSINPPDAIFHTWTFLKDIEDARVEKSEFWYLMIYHEGQLLGTAVLSAFVINLDIFIKAGALIRIIRKAWSGFLKIKILMCGIPASLGQKNIVITDARYSTLFLDRVSEIMDAIAKDQNIMYQAFKEFKEKEIPQFDHLKQKGYFRALSLPYTRMDIQWNDFPTYLGALRYNYKRQILASLKKIKATAEFTLAEKPTAMGVPALLLADAELCTPELFYDSYMAVMNRADSKLETLNLAFFRNFFRSHKEKLVFIALADDRNVHGTAILVPHGHELTFALIGKHPEKDAYDTYFNLIAAMVKYAIENKYTLLNMGQTSYYPKLRVGAKPENVYIYFKSGKLLMHSLLRMLNNVVFPETKTGNITVFKNDG
jgi:predicted N-acyltransferase